MEIRILSPGLRSDCISHLKNCTSLVKTGRLWGRINAVANPSCEIITLERKRCLFFQNSDHSLGFVKHQIKGLFLPSGHTCYSGFQRLVRLNNRFGEYCHDAEIDPIHARRFSAYAIPTKAQVSFGVVFLPVFARSRMSELLRARHAVPAKAEAR